MKDKRKLTRDDEVGPSDDIPEDYILYRNTNLYLHDDNPTESPIVQYSIPHLWKE